MPCFRPLKGYAAQRGETGENGFTFSRREARRNSNNEVTLMEVPCGQCRGCRIDRSREWAIRCVHEATQHEDTMFLTLTYAPEHLPPYGTLVPRHFQEFMKRYRKHVEPVRIRYFHCGEYGEKLARPHYHACIFGHQFNDLYLVDNSNGRRLYSSPSLEKIWGHGFVTVGDLTWQSAAYVARYITKKITGEPAKEHYSRVDPDTGEFIQLHPEYVTMSRRPGLGAEWFNKYRSDVFPHDFVVHQGRKQKTPRYYDRRLRELDPDAHTLVKEKRVLAAQQHTENNTWDRLAVRERVLESKTKMLKRDYENDQ